MPFWLHPLKHVGRARLGTTFWYCWSLCASKGRVIRAQERLLGKGVLLLFLGYQDKLYTLAALLLPMLEATLLNPLV